MVNHIASVMVVRFGVGDMGGCCFIMRTEDNEGGWGGFNGGVIIYDHEGCISMSCRWCGVERRSPIWSLLLKALVNADANFSPQSDMMCVHVLYSTIPGKN